MKAAQPISDASVATWPPDTPAERRKRKVRDSIIEAAETVFAEEGEAGLSMRRLAERIDYSPAAIYKYFNSKDELLATIREQFFERLMVRLQETAAIERRDREGFLACLRAYVQTGIENPNHYRMAFGSFESSKPQEGTLGYEASSRFTMMIQDMIEKGVLRNVDPELASRSVWASVHGLTSLMTAIPDFPQCPDCDSHPLSREDMIEFHAEQIVRGLARDEG
jgi:AcrR family transcriptional regulator